MENILITGGAGFIGSNFAHYLAKHRKFYNLVIYDALTYAGNIDNLKDLKNLVFIEGNICDYELLRETIIKNKIDTIVHFAAESHNDNSLDGPRAFIETNIIGTYNILELCRTYALRLHHISTDEVFGDLDLDDPNKFTELTAYYPSSPYSASKASADHLVRAWVRSFGIKATISNCSNNYGPRQHHEKFIPRQITNALSGLPLKLYGDGLNVRDWIHVDDHNSAVLAILERGKIGETYLIGAGGEKNNKEVIEIISKKMNAPIEYVKDRVGHDRRYAINFSKLSSELQWTPKHTDFEKEIDELIVWYDENRWFWENSKGEVEKEYKKRGQ